MENILFLQNLVLFIVNCLNFFRQYFPKLITLFQNVNDVSVFRYNESNLNLCTLQMTYQERNTFRTAVPFCKNTFNEKSCEAACINIHKGPETYLCKTKEAAIFLTCFRVFGGFCLCYFTILCSYSKLISLTVFDSCILQATTKPMQLGR